MIMSLHQALPLNKFSVPSFVKLYITLCSEQFTDTQAQIHCMEDGPAAQFLDHLCQDAYNCFPTYETVSFPLPRSIPVLW